MNAETIPPPETEGEEPQGLARVWAILTEAGWHETILRCASHLLVLALLAGAVWIRQWNRALFDTLTSLTTFPPAAATIALPPAVAATYTVGESPGTAIPAVVRLADPHTLIPTRGRIDVITYTVRKGDTLFGITEKFNLRPETILWGNYFTLKDDPHLLYPGQDLNILPVDGTYHYLPEGTTLNTLEKIAKFYGVTKEAILEWPGNHLDAQKPEMRPNTWVVVPGGRREFQIWEVPQIRREDKVSGKRTNNFGQCPGGYTGAVGSGVFVWPTADRTISGYEFSNIHHGLDLRAPLGAAIYAVDAGVVVYAGWNDFGYGNLVVIDHGNGWQSAYGHLSRWNVQCGQSVASGELIGQAGNTGRSAGAHLHFEMRYNGQYINPLTVLPTAH